MQLNPQQAQAVSHIEGPLLVIAGAGSGKTRVVTYRIAHLLDQGIAPDSILAVTFTNKAAAEMQERIYKLTQKRVLASTFHSLGARILRSSIEALGYRSHFSIFDEDDVEKVIKECLEETGLAPERALVKQVRKEISEEKNQMGHKSQSGKLKELSAMYQRKMQAYNALDFDDLLFLTVRLWKEHPEILKSYQARWRYILIDEYQDTNEAQHEMMQLLSRGHRNVFAVGDPDQSIYGWRGANIENILRFQEDYPGANVLSLEQNYRSTSVILSAANALISHNQARYKKELWTAEEGGEKIGMRLAFTDREEVAFVLERLRLHRRAELIPFRECVIFYRTHFQSRIFEDALLREKIPYVIVGGVSFYMRAEIKDILSFLRVAVGGSDYPSFARTLNLPRRGIGPAAQEKIKQACQEHGAQDLIAGIGAILEGKIFVKLSAAQKKGLDDYHRLILSLRHLIVTRAPVDEIVTYAIEESGYFAYLDEDLETAKDRKANLAELITKGMEWQEEHPDGTLFEFLEELFLRPPEVQEEEIDALQLMTFHNSKGLEFTVCFMVGMENELFPHASAFSVPGGIEEERRLCYVGMTRARRYLYLSAAQSRHLWGEIRHMTPSMFLTEIPKVYTRVYQ